MSKEKENIFTQIFSEKFGDDLFLSTDFGFIKNHPVYLELSDLNLIRDFGHILDFYRVLEKEGNCIRIKVPGIYEKEVYCECFNQVDGNSDTKWYCKVCNEYICNNCWKTHETHKLHEFYSVNINCSCCYYKVTGQVICNIGNRILCMKCLKISQNGNFITTDPIINFNMNEWIPIRGFLENRNINSKLYCRKIRYTFQNDCMDLRLIHRVVDYDYDEKTTLMTDAIYRIGDIFGVPEDLTHKIFNYSMKNVNYTFRNIIS